MKKTLLKKTLILLVIIALVAIVAVIFDNYKTRISAKNYSKKTEKITRKKQDQVSKKIVENAKKNHEIVENDVLKISKSEFIYGDENAPVTIIEYASLSCPHCASFYREAFDDLREDFIDQGKVRFVYRDFPLNHPALAAAMVAVCRTYGEQDRAKTYYGFVKSLFKTQDSWAFDPQYIDRLEAIAMLDGMPRAEFKRCVDDKKLEEKILSARMIAAKNLSINSTPTFFINGEALEGFVDYKTIKKAIEEKL